MKVGLALCNSRTGPLLGDSLHNSPNFQTVSQVTPSDLKKITKIPLVVEWNCAKLQASTLDNFGDLLRIGQPAPVSHL